MTRAEALREARRLGATVHDEGLGGYDDRSVEILAPEGTLWADSEACSIIVSWTKGDKAEERAQWAEAAERIGRGLIPDLEFTDDDNGPGDFICKAGGCSAPSAKWEGGLAKPPDPFPHLPGCRFADADRRAGKVRP